MKYVLLMLLVADGASTVGTQEFDSLAACEAAGSKLFAEIRKDHGYAFGTLGTRTWCVEKG